MSLVKKSILIKGFFFNAGRNLAIRGSSFYLRLILTGRNLLAILKRDFIINLVFVQNAPGQLIFDLRLKTKK